MTSDGPIPLQRELGTDTGEMGVATARQHDLGKGLAESFDQRAQGRAEARRLLGDDARDRVDLGEHDVDRAPVGWQLGGAVVQPADALTVVAAIRRLASSGTSHA